MKNKLILSAALLLFGVILYAQAPQGLNYQAVARNTAGDPIPNQAIGIQFSINVGGPGGTLAYKETQTATTNQFGIFTVVIGSGTPVTGTLAGVNWGLASMYLTVAIDPTGGTTYTSMGATQLESVPYALYTGNGGWNLAGNTGTNPGNNFIGTIDNQPLKFDVNNQEAGFLDSTNARTFFGYESGFNTTGSDNTGVGFQSLYNNGTGTNNTASGFWALYANTTGAGNTSSGYQSLLANTTGGDNTAFGTYALFSTITGTDNTGIGEAAWPDNGTNAGAVNNWTGLGAGVGTAASNSNMVELGNTSVTIIRGEVAFTTYSDQRIKDNVTENVPGLDFITKLRPVTYNLNLHKQNAIMNAGSNKPDKDFAGKYDIEKLRMTGFIAQEVDQAAKATGFDFSGVVKPANSNDLYSLRYSDFVVPLVKAVQEQQQQIADLKKLVSDLQNTVKQLQK